MADKKWLASLAGLFDPMLRKLAQQLAQSIPQDSPLRSESIESVIGAVKGLAEVYAERFPALSSVAVEKLTDFADFLAVFLAEDGVGTKTRDLLENFLTEAAERLKKATDPQVEFERIQLELGFIKELAWTAAQKPKKETGPAVPALTESLGRLNQSLEKVRDRLKKPKEANHGSPD